MLKIVSGYNWRDEYPGAPWLEGFTLGFQHLPPIRGVYIGVGGGFGRKIDAEMAMRNLRETYPYFDFDNCTYDEFQKFHINQGEQTLKRVLTEYLQW